MFYFRVELLRGNPLTAAVVTIYVTGSICCA